MVSEATRIRAGEAVLSRPLGTIQVVGRQEAVEVHELVAHGGTTPDETTVHFGEALARCREGDLASALADFEALSDDRVAARYAARCREAIAAGEAFRGHWNLTSK